MNKTKRTKPTLRCTKDYDMFELHPHNRDVTRTKLLEQSMKEFGYDPGFPIRCVRNGSGKLRITHGHHRFDVAERLGLGVWFIEAPQDIPLFQSEASAHSWGTTDYTVARARAGEETAEAVLEFRQKTGMPMGCAVALVSGDITNSGKTLKKLKDGTLRVGNMRHANAVAELTAFCRDYGATFSTNSYFIRAISMMLKTPGFDQEVFRNKVKRYPQLLEPQRNVDEYLGLIETIYNYRKSPKAKIPLVFAAHAASAERRYTGRKRK